MNEAQMKIFYEVFTGLPRQAPGSRQDTRLALSHVRELPAQPVILDLGCGTGESTLVLAEALKQPIVAVDNYQPYLDLLDKQAQINQLDIRTQNADITNIEFASSSSDLVWAEGSLFVMGVAAALERIYHWLKPGGYLSFSDVCWTKHQPPPPSVDFWKQEYPEIKHWMRYVEMAEEIGFSWQSSFELPKKSWTESYYQPLQQNVTRLQKKYPDNPTAIQILRQVQQEIDTFHQYGDSYGYIFFILQKPA